MDSNLIQAIENGNIEYVKEYLNIHSIVDINLKNATEGETLLHIAVHHNRLEIVKFLIFKGAYINIEDNVGWSPIHDAAFNGYFDIVEYLLSKGANINIKDMHGWTPLHCAVHHGKL